MWMTEDRISRHSAPVVVQSKRKIRLSRAVLAAYAIIGAAAVAVDCRVNNKVCPITSV